MAQEKAIFLLKLTLGLLLLLPVACQNTRSGSSYSLTKVDASFCEELDLGCGGANRSNSERVCCLETRNGVGRYRCCNLDWIINVSVGLPFVILIVVFTFVGIGLCCCFYHKRRKLTRRCAYTTPTTTTTGNTVYRCHHHPEPTGKEDEGYIIDHPSTYEETETNLTVDPPAYKWSLEKRENPVLPPPYSEAVQ